VLTFVPRLRSSNSVVQFMRRESGVSTMTELVVKLPDELARRARSAGLLTDGAIQRLLEEAMRREAGRQLLQVAERLHAAGAPPVSEEEIVAEVKAVRAERRARETQGADSKKP
jgi:post-segregation antitoxin (ccd killing protein)